MNRTRNYVFYSLLAIFAGLVIFQPHWALASTTQGTEFQSLYQKMLDWINGLPGIMGAMVILIFGVYASFFGGKHPFYFFGAALAAAAIFLVPNIAQSLGGAVW